MRPKSMFTYPAATLCLILAATTQARSIPDILRSFHKSSDQSLLHNQGVLVDIMPPTGEVSTGVIISDVIGKTQAIGIFSGLTRDIDTVSDRLDDASKNATVLAPDNSVMRNLERKPWEDPEDYKSLGTKAYDGKDGEDRAHRNLRRFVESHIIPQSPWEEGQKIKTLAGNEVWYETKDGKKKIQPGDIEVTSIADKVSNGEVWIIGGSLA
ncbi:hypothetical protein BS50DRAFT_559323 [Corynespora cassiicola Philippines]|uniref:FAS1 domain-containing protein n=1 Tax=Corynespora cassiicola Philippines TaxID=1448308 RepID=A0A2T2ND33_CORCC|nr:hypothetical protein BS50DRAFT_559323 [Corynespora cassiicola Philippines]